MSYYVAYGSNINLDQMEMRCPSAKVVGTGYIEDHALIFGGRVQNAVATISRKKGSLVPVLVWTISETDEMALDRYEGYPFFYRKELIRVNMEDGKDIDCMIYLLNPASKGVPSDYYVDVIRQGYRQNGLNEHYLDQALGEVI